MERNFKNDGLERFLQENADQCRMYPSAKVWNNISNRTNSRKRWLGLGLSVLLFSFSIIGYYLVDNPSAIAPLAPAHSISTPNLPGNPSNLTPQTINSLLKSNHNIVIANNNFKPGTDKLLLGANAIDNTAFTNSLSKSSEAIHLTALPGNSFAFNIFNQQQIADANLPEVIVEEHPLPSPNTVNKKQTKSGKRNKILYQISFTPTISYRKLSENQSYTNGLMRTNMPNTYALFNDINSMVTHKPNMGLELGFIAKYPVTKSIMLRSGLQFNINRYGIKASSHSPELATIALNNGYKVDYLNTSSKYRNVNNSGTDWIQNLYFQLALPIGFEAKLSGNNNTQFGIASTVQPTYTIGDNTYLLSTDYKNYVQAPSLIRRWNVNTSFETFISYSTGQLKWQVGPQVRYQLLSSFINKYPVKENLFDFGFKVGVSLTNQ